MNQNQTELQRHTIKFEFISMTTRCVLQLIHHDPKHIEQVAQKIFENTKRLETTYNFFSPNSWLTKEINQRTSNTVALDKEGLIVFQKIRQLSQATQEIFDVSVGTLRVPASLKDTEDKRVSQVHALYEQGITREQLSEQYQSAMGLNAWSLDMDKACLTFADERTRFDLGGVIKEYAVDCAMEIAQQQNCDGLISFGGDLKVLGKKTNGDDYKVGIKNPFNPSETCMSVKLYNQALTTSGNYERQDQAGKQTFSHIIGQAGRLIQHHDSTSSTIKADTQAVSVTVISPDTLTSGVFSTALMIQPNLLLPDQKLFGAIKGIIIDDNAQLHAVEN